MTPKALLALKVALVSEALATEFETLAGSAASASEALAQHLQIALCDQEAFVEILSVLESGAASLSDRAKAALAIALCDVEATVEVIAALEA